MKKSLSIISLIILSALLGIVVVSQIKAGSDDNVFEWAWSENIGWISFNSTNCDANGDGFSDGTAGCPPIEEPVANYGVDIDSDGNFSGYAWSENIGWISFNRTDTGAPPGAPDYNPYLAKVDLDMGEVSGWARVLAYGNAEGWIKLRCYGDECITSDYGVYIDRDTGEFHDWAWGDTVTGWISFNCSNCEDTVCDGYPPCGNLDHPDYKVKTSFSFNQLPYPPSELSVSPGDYCDIPLEHFHWTFSDPNPGDNQGAYQLQVDIQGDWNIGDGEFDSGKVPSGTEDKKVLVTPDSVENKLDYDTHYYWRVRVWDENDATSTDWGYGPEFDTEAHIYPNPDFDWSPSSPTGEEIVQFCSIEELGVCPQDLSTCYKGDPIPFPPLPPSPSCGGKTFSWSFPAGTEFATGSSATSPNPEVRFTTTGDKYVSLQITDDIGSCSTPLKKIEITLPLPKWKEIKP